MFVLVFSHKGFAASTGDQILEKSPVIGQSGQKYVPGEIIVKFNPGVSGRAIAEINSRHGASVISTSRFAGFKRLKIPRGKSLEEMVEIYNRNPNVEYAEPNYIAHASMTPNDAYYLDQWHLDNDEYGGINMESAWDIETGDSSVIVAVIDTGVAYEDYEEFIDNPGRGRDYWITYEQASDLANTNFVDGYDFVNDDIHPNDDEGHGTHVTGTIAQSTNNTIGVAGVAFDTSIMPVKVLDNTGAGTYANIADGIYFAADGGFGGATGDSGNSANIINMSLGGPSGSITLENAVAYAYENGVTIVCSSGNDGSATTISYPAAYDDYCIAVGATRYDEAVAGYSNAGSSLDLTAPGGDLNVDQNDDGYGDGVLQQTFGSSPTDWGYWFYQGTSMAAPHVSGVAALVIANNVATTPDDVRYVLESTSEDKGSSGWDSEYGWGIVDAYAALNYSPVPNDPPIADANGPYTGTEDTAVPFDGSGSSDPDGDTITYSWNFGDGNIGTGISPVHTYSAGGTYTITLVVNDGRVNSDPSTTTAEIEEINDYPVANAGSDQSAFIDATVTFDGSDSYDPDGSISSYAWDFGDDSVGSGITTTHEYSAAGTYTVTLTVTDNGGLTATDTAVVSVTEQATLAMHVANIAMSTRRTGVNVVATATITVVDADNDPVVGATVSGSWSGLTSDSDSGATGTSGVISLSSNKVKNPNGTFTFTVENITKDGWGYDSADNLETSDSITAP
ncbi:MAG: S8 family serine peptidase [Candidatus Omnitrophota bacterium]